MIIGSIKEQDPAETRVALTPAIVQKLIAGGHSVMLEAGIGEKVGFANHEYAVTGAEITDSPHTVYKKSQILLQILPPSANQLSLLQKSQLLAADFRNFNLSTYRNKALFIRLELVPRISKAQSIDILSAQNTIRGYMGALYALSRSPRIAPQLMTAAASLKAATALVIGAGVTGLQAASVFKRLGCRVTILDINDQNRELAKSVGADFATAATKEELSALLTGKDFLLAAAAAADGTSPQIIGEHELKTMSPGAVVIDTTLQNIHIAENHKKTETYQFYRHLMAERLAPLSASELWANNMYNLISLIKAPDGTFNLDTDSILPMLYPSKNEIPAASDEKNATRLQKTQKTNVSEQL